KMAFISVWARISVWACLPTAARRSWLLVGADLALSTKTRIAAVSGLEGLQSHATRGVDQHSVVRHHPDARIGRRSCLPLRAPRQQSAQFRFAEIAPLSHFQRAELDIHDADAAQLGDPVAEGFRHQANLPVQALREHDAESELGNA